MAEEKIYPKGLWFNEKNLKQPDFVIGSISISKKMFIDWLNGQEEDEKGYIHLQVLQGKENKPYVVLDTYKR